MILILTNLICTKLPSLLSFAKRTWWRTEGDPREAQIPLAEFYPPVLRKVRVRSYATPAGLSYFHKILSFLYDFPYF